jgi:hypothetical protein
MNNEQEICLREPMILAARAEGRRDDASAQHLLTCASCREADALAVQMRQLIAVNVDKQPPAADVVWMMAQLSKPRRTRWTVETWRGLAGLGASALLASMLWPAIQGYLSSLLPMQMMTIVPMLVSAIVATALAVIALRTQGLLTDD